MKSILKKITVGVFVLGTAATFSAQKIDAKAKSILDAVSSKYKAKDNGMGILKFKELNAFTNIGDLITLL